MTRSRSLVLSLDAVLPQASETPYARIRPIARAGNALILVFVLGFGAWAAVAPLESAAIAPGVLESETSRKSIQHLEGGIVREIQVRDGDRVEAGVLLMRLDDTRARTRLQGLRQQHWAALAREARLDAERQGRERLAFPPALREAGLREPSVVAIMQSQEAIFDSSRRVVAAQFSILSERRAQIEKEVEALEAQEGAVLRRVAIVSAELEAVRGLVEQGIAPRPRLTALERELAEVEGRRGEGSAHIARALQAIAEAQTNLLKLEMDRQNEVNQAMNDVQNEIHQLAERIEAAEDEVARTFIRAPNAGIVTELRVRTLGAVVAAGAPLLDLVPTDDRLVVTARLRPEDVDVVRVGQSAEVHLLGNGGRRAAPVAARVSYVAADRHADPRAGEPHYVMTLRIEDERIGAPDGLEIIPGMPVQVFVKTGETTAALYALAPLLDSIDRAFREPGGRPQ